MVFLPRDLVDADGLQEFHDVLSPEIMRRAVRILGHEDDRHIGEEIGNLLPEGCGTRCVLRDERFDRDDGEGHALFYDDCSVNCHGNSPLVLCNAVNNAVGEGTFPAFFFPILYHISPKIPQQKKENKFLQKICFEVLTKHIFGNIIKTEVLRTKICKP